MTADDDEATELLTAVAAWARSRPDIFAAALVGSYARGEQTRASDVDVMLIAKDPDTLIQNTEWIEAFGKVDGPAKKEEWGAVTSIHVLYESGPEVEFSIASKQWLEKPLDEGTRKVLESGARTIYDPECLFGQGVSL